jgi:hypothetical protein
MGEVEDFEAWFNSTFLFSRDPASTLLNCESKTMTAKYNRICEVCKRMIKNPNKPTQRLREEIAMDFFISMRCSLDYINYAKLVLERWNTSK